MRREVGGYNDHVVLKSKYPYAAAEFGREANKARDCIVLGAAGVSVLHV